jgi:hypothetical protein
MTALLTKPRSERSEALSNPFRLPRGERLRKELVAVFNAQRKAILRYLRGEVKGGGDVAAYSTRPLGTRLSDLQATPPPPSLIVTDLDAKGQARLDCSWGGPPLPSHVGEACSAGDTGLNHGSVADKDADSLATGGPPLPSKDQMPPPLPVAWPDWHDYGLGALDVAQRVVPLLTLTWEQAAAKFAPRVGLDPDEWSVVNPHTEQAIWDAALAFAESTNATTSDELHDALERTRAALVEGVVEHGEALPALTKRVNAIFEGAETWRARRIAWTETSRAVHAAQVEAARRSGVVTGWRWLASADACSLCLAIAARAPAVRLGDSFAVIGDNPTYAEIEHPPAHPHCNCTLVEILDTDAQPDWSETLDQPEPATEEEQQRVGEELLGQYNEILGPQKPPRPPVAVKPKPAPRKRPPKPSESSYTLEIRGPLDDADVAEFRQAVERFPRPVLETLRKFGVRFVYGDKLSSIDPTEAALQPRGWGTGTWENADGAYAAASKEIRVSRTYRKDTGEYAISYRKFGVLRHETGHGFDAALGWASGKDQFRKAYLQDIAAIPAESRKDLAYFLQPGHAGREEAFAEVFAQLFGRGASNIDLRNHFPQTAALIFRYTQGEKP